VTPPILRIDLNAEDDSGQNWALIGNAGDPSLVLVGAVMVAGTPSFWSVVRITSGALRAARPGRPRRQGPPGHRRLTRDGSISPPDASGRSRSLAASERWNGATSGPSPKRPRDGRGMERDPRPRTNIQWSRASALVR